MATNDGNRRTSSASTTEQLGERLQKEKDAATHAAGDAWEGAKDAGSEALRQAGRQAEAQGEKLKEGASDELDAFAAAIKAASDKLSERQPGIMSDLMGQAANGIHGLSEALHRRSTGDLVDAVRDFGRSNPTAFIAGSVLTGFAIGRFAGSSATHRRRSDGTAATRPRSAGTSATASGGTSATASGGAGTTASGGARGAASAGTTTAAGAATRTGASAGTGTAAPGVSGTKPMHTGG